MAEEIEHEKSFPTNPNMTYFTFAKADKMAFDVDDENGAVTSWIRLLSLVCEGEAPQ